MHEHWHERWREGRVGWHEAEGNASLRKHWQASNREVLVPLCGKSLDLLWLEEQGNTVVGVELSDIAVREFFEQHDLAYTVRDAALPVYLARDRRISIHCGDFMEFEHAVFDAWYDRGALVAIPPELRPAYAEHVNALLAPDACKLLITLEYDDAIAAGPPFSVAGDEVTGYWPELERVDRYDDIANGPPKFREAGLTEMFESVWR